MLAVCQSVPPRAFTLMQRHLWIAIIAIVGIAIIVVIGYRLQVQPGASIKAPIKIGVSLPLSGDSAIIGKENLNGIALAVEAINRAGGVAGRPLELVVKDDQMDDKETIAQYRQFTKIDGIKYVLTNTYGGFLALAKQTEADGTILIDSLDASEELANQGQNAFAIGLYDESIGQALAKHLNDQQVTEVAVIANKEDPFIQLTLDALTKAYRGKTQIESYTFATNDFRTLLTKLHGYDRIVLLGWQETGRIVKQAHELNLRSQFFGIDTFASKSWRENTGGHYDGLVFTFWAGSVANPDYVEFLRAYQVKFSQEPENVLYAATGYDAVRVLASALERCDDEVACVSQALRTKIKAFPGASGAITIDSDGITRSMRETMFIYRQGQIVELK